ncbi:MAG: hypothetical protein Q8P18_29965, partial [Pseudomonadota bacterium]|nr:hypothetical protein [Pseudomonadota bacterium]
MSPRPLLALVLLVGCEPPVETPKSNEAPVAAITSHADGDTVDEGYVVSFRGTITDADHGPEDLVATWFAGDEELCAEAPVSATGESTCDAVLGVDEGAIQLLGRDPEGATGVAELSLVVNATDAPVAEILSPTTTGRYYAGLALPVEATIADAEDDADSLTVIWTDETGAELTIDSTPEGGVLQGEMAFDAGDHALTLTVTDLTGKVGVTSVDFVVGAENTAPSCTITSPLDGGDAEVGTYVDLTATVGDLDQPVTELVATWSSDLDGPLGGTAIGADGTIAHGLDTLTFGTHVLTLTVVDELGAVCTDDLLFSIGTPPDATIEAPLDAELYNEGDLISFLATVSDSGTSPDALALTWESDRDGLLDAAPADSTGLAAFDADWLSAGEHVVTLNVTDVEGLYAEAAVTFTVNGLPTAPALGISPASPFTTDALVAAITVDAIDPEGDSLSYTWAWTRDGAATAYVTDTVPADATTRGEVWEVIATPNDGWGAGAPGSTSVVIGNSAPVLTNAVLSPDPAWAGDTLSCTPDAATDADGDTVSYTYAWMVDGVSIGSTASSLDDSSWSAGDAVVCVVTPTDGTDAGVSVPSNTVTIDNSTPAITSVSISPVPAAADDTLTCSASGFTDPDGDLDQTTFAWTVNGAAAGAGVTLSGAFVGGDTVVCTATPFDGTTSGTALSATLTVENTPPVLASVSLTPATPTVADTLTCAPGVTTDIDGTTSFTWRYTWTIDGGAIAATTSTLTSADFDHGDVVACSVTPNDGTEDGAAMASSAVTIQNTAPVLASVTLSPDPAWEGDTLSCSPDTATDADGDSVSYAYAWTIDGAAIGATSSTLGDTSWSAGNVVACVVTPTDGFDAGSPVTSNSVTIDNSTPTIASVAISPASPAADDTLTCAASGFSDRDGDADRTTYAWTLNGAAAGTGSTLLVAAYGGDTVVCTATPFDGTTSGTALTDTVTLENTPPVLASVSLTPTSPTEADTLTCAPGVTTDIDGTTSFSYAYAWTVDGGTISATASTLSPTEFDRGDVIRCRITPNDGTEDGASLTSSAVTIQNTAPGVVSVTLSPSAPDTDDTVTASATGTDLDGDTVTFTYAWYVDGTVVAATGATLSGTYFARDEEVYVVATPTDGTTSGTAMASASVTVANTAPSISAATITPDPATVSSTLTCAASGFSDLDGDPNATTYAWTVDGAAAGTGATLTSGFGSGDVVVCTATPSDGTDTGTARTDSITIANTAPVLASVSLTPTTAYEASTLTCAPGSTTDADGTTSFTYTYAWYVNSALVAPVTTTLTGAYFGRGDSVSCRVTPNDGASSGSAVSSSAVTIGNTAPVLATVTLNSYAPTTNATLTASVTSSDADSDTVTYTYAWYV